MDLSAFSPDQIELLKAALLADTSGRSPLRPRQLHDLRLPPTKDDPRPTFVWSAESPRNSADLTRTAPYPRLMWSPTGDEITVEDAKAQLRFTEQGFVLTPPANAEAPDPMDLIRQQLDSLSPEDRKVLIAAASKDRNQKIQEAMAGLSEADFAALAATLETKQRRSA